MGVAKQPKTRREETTTMKKDTPTLGKGIQIDEARIK